MVVLVVRRAGMALVVMVVLVLRVRWVVRGVRVVWAGCSSVMVVMVVPGVTRRRVGVLVGMVVLVGIRV